MIHRTFLTIGLTLCHFALVQIAYSQPANDNPCGAYVLDAQIGSSCIPTDPLSLTDATATGGFNPAPLCGTYKTGDLWFSYELTDTSDVVITTSAGTGPGAIVDAAFAIYTADACDGTFTELVKVQSEHQGIVIHSLS